jgi:hypothetical protein
MANTFILGGSPLGLIGVQSRPTRDGMSTFNGGKSRNVNVGDYNLGRKQKSGNSRVSLFTGGTITEFWANIGKVGTDQNTLNGEYKGINRDTLHNNDVYDTSILNIIEKLSACPKASLRPQDFAYLKDLGVYPNNRLMIARKFASPQKDNILDKKGQAPLATIISWRKPEEDFLKISYGEEWMEAEADFTNVLNKAGKDFGIGGSGGLPGVGDMGGSGFNILPLPGFTETLQRELLQSLGILETEAERIERIGDTSRGDARFILPSGNPNLIKMAKRRKLIDYGQAGAGLKCSVSIAMEATYEQKFISGIDPTIAYMDIINNLVHFGTQKSDNYGLSKKFNANLDRWTSNPSELINDIINGLKDIFENITTKIEETFKQKEESADQKDKRDAALKNEKGEKKEGKALLEAQKKLALEGLKDKDGNSIIDKLVNAVEDTVKKYKIELMGIANSLSGAPSTPWHITIGNPLRPVFCSGDMYVQDMVSLDLGKDLAFNDLPSTIKVSFTLTNARPWGLQEILAKFNTGYIRTVNVRKDFTISESPGKDYTIDSDGEIVSEENINSSSSDRTPPTPGVQSNISTKANENEGKPQNEQ